MTRNKTFLIVQSVFCALIAGLLAAAALQLYFDGAAKQAEGDLFYYMYTREKAGAKLLPILPLFFTALGLTLAGLILVAISICLTLISGLIPSRVAARKDPVEALRTE